MSATLITKDIYIDGVLADPDTVKLSSKDETYGVKRSDNDAVVVADGTAMDSDTTGKYYYLFEDPAGGLTYDYVIEWVYDGETHHIEGEAIGGTDSSDNLYDLLPQIQPYVGGVGTSLLQQVAREVAGEFCKATEVWREHFEDIATVEDQEDYDLSGEHSYSAWIKRVYAVTIEDVDWGFSEVSADGDTVTISPSYPTDDDDLDAWVVLIPEETCSQYPAWFLERWGKALVYGVRSKLKLMANVPWSDPQGGQIERSHYMSEVSAAKREVRTERGRGLLTMVQRRFV